MKTGSWFGPLPEGHIRIGISRGVPRSGVPAGYRIFRTLAPGPWFNSVPPVRYDELYREILGRLDPAETVEQIDRLAGGLVPVLCCWERVGDGSWCHRAMVSSWLQGTLGLVVPEIGYERLTTQDAHPMMPVELR